VTGNSKREKTKIVFAIRAEKTLLRIGIAFFVSHQTKIRGWGLHKLLRGRSFPDSHECHWKMVQDNIALFRDNDR
jgi:hypothetical protein